MRKTLYEYLQANYHNAELFFRWGALDPSCTAIIDMLTTCQTWSRVHSNDTATCNSCFSTHQWNSIVYYQRSPLSRKNAVHLQSEKITDYYCFNKNYFHLLTNGHPGLFHGIEYFLYFPSIFFLIERPIISKLSLAREHWKGP